MRRCSLCRHFIWPWPWNGAGWNVTAGGIERFHGSCGRRALVR